MNTRIKELAEQCTTQYRDGNGGYIDHVDTEKFAELIVKECLNQADIIRDGCDADGEDEQALGADWVALAIARYFGVE